MMLVILGVVLILVDANPLLSLVLWEVYVLILATLLLAYYLEDGKQLLEIAQAWTNVKLELVTLLMDNVNILLQLLHRLVKTLMIFVTLDLVILQLDYVKMAQEMLMVLVTSNAQVPIVLFNNVIL
jgi:hypothetical protein